MEAYVFLGATGYRDPVTFAGSGGPLTVLTHFWTSDRDICDLADHVILTEIRLNATGDITKSVEINSY